MKLSDSEFISILKLIRSENVGPRTFYDLIKFFGTASEALKNIEEFSIRGGRSQPIKIYSDSEIENEIKLHKKIGADFLTYKDHNYPKLLKYIPDAPPIISYLGNKNIFLKPCISIVGARNASINAKSLCKKIANSLFDAGFSVVSGLARGVDTEAHKGSIDSTIGVIAGGIDHIYPIENTNLYKSIQKNGAILAELPIGNSPLAQHFPQRNRIISGMSRATIVIEASLKSGSLITAKFALDQNREVCAVPGFPLDYRSSGVNRLIKDGAFVIESVDSLVEHVLKLENYQNNFQDSDQKEYKNSCEFRPAEVTDLMRKKIISLLSATPITIDEIYNESELSFPIIYTIILELEIAGRIIKHPGNQISLNY